ncbi:MAG: hypothetical protein K9W42_03700 [Candidatus Heimdallarchaeota archaeon]|nr:hypothetical protein [Candidatus Heimdallarchaeota archaeon]
MSKKRMTAYYTIFLVVNLFILSTTPIRINGSAFISVQTGFDRISITSSKMAFIINNFRPQFTWWHDNATAPDEIFNVYFMGLYEYFGPDDYLSGAGELGGLSYNLDTSNWAYEITETVSEVKVNLTLAGLANDASLSFIVHISEQERALTYTGYYISAFTEAWLEIIINNWKLTPGAKGVAIKSEVFESANTFGATVVNDSSQTLNNLDSLFFISYPGTSIDKAYFKWVMLADYFNETNDFLTVKYIGKAFFNNTYNAEFATATHLWLSYPKFNTILTIKHNTILGVYKTTPGPSYAANVPLLLVAGLTGLVFVLLIIRRKCRTEKLPF